jgi:hypothetical protein
MSTEKEKFDHKGRQSFEFVIDNIKYSTFAYSEDLALKRIREVIDWKKQQNEYRKAA